MFKVEQNDRGYRYIELRGGSHERYTLRIWVSNKIKLTPTEVEGEMVLDFPITNAYITKTPKGSLVLHPGDGTVFFYQCSSGYRGGASVDVINGGEIIGDIHRYHSPRGSLGSTHCVFINGGPVVEVRWHRSGRRVDQHTGVVRLTADGNVEEVIDDPDVCDLLE